MLIILKLFKLKLLLFLPLILGLASFKKLLGFLAVIIPGLIGFFKICKPLQSSFGQSNYYNTPHYSPAGIGYQPHFKEPTLHSSSSLFPDEYSSSYYGNNGELTFRRDPNHAQNLAYSAYTSYRNAPSNEGKDGDGGKTSTKKSILPDS